MTFSRTATIDWNGGLMDGGGVVKAGTGAFEVPVTFPRRIGEPEGVTSPEELIAAAHATCFAMVLAGALGRNNAKTKKTHVKCTISADKTDAGIKIAKSRLEVEVEGLEGIDAGSLESLAKEAEGRCPVSNALRGWLAIEVATLVR
jgi:osmotically inducible protein OsmC